MARNVFIIHGTAGSPEGNWFPWLKKELEAIGCRVFVPRFPTPEGQSLENWLKTFKEYERFLDEESILVGHSLGPSFILNVLERLSYPVKAAFLVSGFTGKLGNKEFDPLIESFSDRTFDWNKIRNNCRNFFVYNSDDDPYVPIEKGKFIAEKLGAKLSIIKNGGHLNAEFGYLKFEQLLNDIKKLLKGID
ncbi:serine hydrolase family protein [archaeon]|nr:serine hydrolase family protein [archaeon]